MYRFLASLYLGPLTGDLLRRLLAEDTLDELAALLGGRSVAKLRRYAARTDLEQELPGLRQEYMDLFAVPTGRYVAPFGDAYGGEVTAGPRQHGPLLGEQAVAVSRFYRVTGAEMSPECKELPTHVAVELSFMSFLCGREAAALRAEEGGNNEVQVPLILEYRNLEERFLREHLNSWLPRLSRRIGEQARSDLYRGLAVLTEEFVARDLEALAAMQIGPERGGAPRATIPAPQDRH